MYVFFTYLVLGIKSEVWQEHKKAKSGHIFGENVNVMSHITSHRKIIIVLRYVKWSSNI